ncbi:lipopolysaccharide biosynthesis protein [Spirosoma soli]|uniref:Lipopolysaccharide biosynthesis protein n=1 Tax=Spirosoma soli TaxID=1770529 RepID=A0ABW5M183_9BACT
MKKNIIFSFLIKLLSVIVNLLYVPLIINYINAERYGIWLTISSFIGWMGLLDIGFGNGLRNKYAEAIALNDIDAQRKIVNTTLFVLIVISFFILVIGSIAVNHVNWDSLLGVSEVYREELKELFYCVIILFSVQFIFQIITPIYYAIQRSSMVSFSNLLGNIFGLVGVLILKKYSQPSLISLGFIIMFGNILSFFILFSKYFFIERRGLLNIHMLPDLEHVKSIFSLGVKFFIVNIAYVVQYQSTNFLISKYFSFENVTEFNIAFKLFSVGAISFSIIISPVWSTVTNAYISNDYEWIERLIKKLLLMWLFICVGCCVALMLSDDIYKLWIGNNIQIPFSYSLGAAIIICTNCFSSIFIQVLNGLSKVNLQFWLSVVVIIIFIPLAYYLSVRLSLGVFGICIAIVLSNFNGMLVAPIQLSRIVYKMKKNT